MNRILTIAQREFMAMIGTKAFLITLIMMPLLMGGGAVLLPMMSKIEGGQERRVAVIDHTGELAAKLVAAATQRNEAIQAMVENDEVGTNLDGEADAYNIEIVDAAGFEDDNRLDLSNEIFDGDLYAFIELPAELTQPGQTESATVRFISNSGTLSELRGWIAGVLRSELRTRNLVANGIDPAATAAAEPNFQVKPSRPYKADADGKPIIKSDEDGDKEMLQTLITPLILMGLMFLVIFLAAQPMLESAMEEKTQKISEVMLGNVSPNELLTGKLLGNVAGSLVVMLLYAVGGGIALSRLGMADMIPMSTIGWFLLFQILGVLLFSSVFMVIGASVTQLKEAQSLLIPVWLVLMAPLMVWLNVIRNPNGLVATSLTFFPPSTPLTAILRLGTGAAIPAWQLPAAAVLLLICTAAIVVLAGRIYRASLLRSDGATTILQILRRAA